MKTVKLASCGMAAILAAACSDPGGNAKQARAPAPPPPAAAQTLTPIVTQTAPPPTDLAELAKLPAVGFTTPVQELAERFHMDETLLKALNPGADFTAPGTKIVVAALGPDKLPAAVTRIEVDKTRRQVRAFGGPVL